MSITYNLLSNIYNDIHEDLEKFCTQLDKILKSGIFTCKISLQHKISKIKICNSHRQYLHLSHIKIYNSDHTLIDDELLKDNVKYHIGSKYNNIDKFKLNHDIEPYMFHTLNGIENNYIRIDFIQPISISYITIRNRTDNSYKRCLPLSCYIQYENGEIKHELNNINYVYNFLSHLTYKIDLLKYNISKEQFIAICHMLFLAYFAYFSDFRTFFLKYQTLNIDTSVILNFINNHILKKRSYQLTFKYADVKSFNLYTDQEKYNYLHTTNNMIKILYNITPYIFYAFGTLLGFIREKSYFIPYDYDIDIMMIVNSEKFIDLESFQTFFIQYCKKNNKIKIVEYGLSYYHITYNHSQRFDLFVGIKDTHGTCIYYGNKLCNIKDIYPTIDINIMDIMCPIPRNPFYFLEKWYGKDWRIPKDE